MAGCQSCEKLRCVPLNLLHVFYFCFFFSFSFPNLLKTSALIGFIKNKDAPAWWGFLIAALMFICAVLQTLILHQHFQYCFVTGMRLRTGITGVIYRKVRLEAFNGLEHQAVAQQVASVLKYLGKRRRIGEEQSLENKRLFIWRVSRSISVMLYGVF